MSLGVPAPQQTEYPDESYSVISDCPCPDHGCPRLVRHVFVWPVRPVTVNVATRSHWRVAAQFTAEWREAFRLMSQGCAPLAWCNITVQTIHGTNRRMDACAEALAVKAALDGIVDGGVLEDDNPLFVCSIKFLAPVYVKGDERVIVMLEGPAA